MALTYVDRPYGPANTDTVGVAEGIGAPEKKDLSEFGIYDVLGVNKPTEKPDPGIGPDGIPYMNIEDPKWGTEAFPGTVGRSWAKDQLVMGLPVVEDKPTTCEDLCVKKSKKRIDACNALRKRVKDALEKAGCPCEIEGKDKPSLCGSSYTATKRSRARRSRLRWAKAMRSVRRSRRL